MSKFVDDIIYNIRKQPETWSVLPRRTQEKASGIASGRVQIRLHGNSALASIIDVDVDGIEMTITYWDRFFLERAVSWWFRQVRLADVRISYPLDPDPDHI
jgi:hypothetical protein